MEKKQDEDRFKHNKFSNYIKCKQRERKANRYNKGLRNYELQVQVKSCPLIL